MEFGSSLGAELIIPGLLVYTAVRKINKSEMTKLEPFILIALHFAIECLIKHTFQAPENETYTLNIVDPAFYKLPQLQSLVFFMKHNEYALNLIPRTLHVMQTRNLFKKVHGSYVILLTSTLFSSILFMKSKSFRLTIAQKSIDPSFISSLELNCPSRYALSNTSPSSL